MACKLVAKVHQVVDCIQMVAEQKVLPSVKFKAQVYFRKRTFKETNIT